MSTAHNKAPPSISWRCAHCGAPFKCAIGRAANLMREHEKACPELLRTAQPRCAGCNRPLELADRGPLCRTCEVLP